MGKWSRRSSIIMLQVTRVLVAPIFSELVCLSLSPGIMSSSFSINPSLHLESEVSVLASSCDRWLGSLSHPSSLNSFAWYLSEPADLEATRPSCLIGAVCESITKGVLPIYYEWVYIIRWLPAQYSCNEWEVEQLPISQIILPSSCLGRIRTHLIRPVQQLLWSPLIIRPQIIGELAKAICCHARHTCY